MIYGYCRCSTNESKQDITRQIKELQTLGVAKNNIFREYESGIKLNRVELNRILNIVNPGDTIVATEVSRITRSTKQLCDIIEIAKICAKLPNVQQYELLAYHELGVSKYENLDRIYELKETKTPDVTEMEHLVKEANKVLKAKGKVCFYKK